MDETEQIEMLRKDIQDLKQKLLRKVNIQYSTDNNEHIRKEVRDLRALLKEKLLNYDLISQANKIGADAQEDFEKLLHNFVSTNYHCADGEVEPDDHNGSYARELNKLYCAVQKIMR